MMYLCALCKDRCGNAEADPAIAAVPTQQRLLEFAGRNWKNKAFRQMTFGLFPPAHAFRERSELNPPQDLDQPGTVELIPVVERILGTYTAVCT